MYFIHNFRLQGDSSSYFTTNSRFVCRYRFPLLMYSSISSQFMGAISSFSDARLNYKLTQLGPDADSLVTLILH